MSFHLRTRGAQCTATNVDAINCEIMRAPVADTTQKWVNASHGKSEERTNNCYKTESYDLGRPGRSFDTRNFLSYFNKEVSHAHLKCGATKSKGYKTGVPRAGLERQAS